MNRYFAIFKPTNKAIEVEFPDLIGCVTFGKDWDEAIENAADVLAAWLANAEPKFIKPASTYKQLQKRIKDKNQLMPIMVNPAVIESYQELKRFNVIFPVNTLNKVDKYRIKLGLKRSKILQMAAEEYIAMHPLGSRS